MKYLYTLPLIGLLFGPGWHDEYFTLWLAQLPLERLIQATAGDVHPPLYYLLAWLSVQVFGPHLWAVRLPALLAWLAAVWIFARMFVPVWDKFHFSHISLGLMVVSPFMLQYSTEARPYSLLLLCVLGTFYALNHKRMILAGLSVVAGFYSHNSMALYAPLVLIVMAEHGKEFGWEITYKKFLLFVMPGLLYLPWLPTLYAQYAGVAGGYWVLPLHPGRLVMFIHQVVMGVDNWTVFVSAPLVIGLLIYGIHNGFVEGDLPVWLFGLAFGPLIVGAMISWLATPILIGRVLIGSAPFIYIILGWAVYDLGSRWGAAPVVGLLAPVFVLAALPNYVPSASPPMPSATDGQLCYHLNTGTLVTAQALRPQCQHVLWPSAQSSDGLTQTAKRAMGIQQAYWGSLPPGERYIFYTETPYTHPAETAYHDRITAGAELVIEGKGNFSKNQIHFVEDKR